MTIYKLYVAGFGTEPNAAYYIDGDKMVSFLFDPANTCYQQYLAWLEAGNTPLPAEEQ